MDFNANFTVNRFLSETYDGDKGWQNLSATFLDYNFAHYAYKALSRSYGQTFFHYPNSDAQKTHRTNCSQTRSVCQ